MIGLDFVKYIFSYIYIISTIYFVINCHYEHESIINKEVGSSKLLFYLT